MSIVRLLLRALALLLVGQAAAQTAPVANTATLSWAAGGARASVSSNTVTLDVAHGKVPTSLVFRMLPPGVSAGAYACDGGTGVPSPMDAGELGAASPLAASEAAAPVVVVLTDPTSNKDAAVRDTATVEISAGGRMTPVRLSETGPNTGIFAGAVLTDGSVACAPRLMTGEMLSATFAEDDDSLGSSASVLVDPAGAVFDSTTGAMVDGATVTLTDEAGAPATVYGDDGVSRYPSTVVTGTMVTDASGRTYRAASGRYRFPLVAPGRYVLHVTPPAGRTAPSTVSESALAALRDPAGRAFDVADASYGRVFTVVAGQDMMVDIPVDPAAPGTLVLSKSASLRQASFGDVVQYRLTLTNRGQATAGSIRVADALPPGLRYQAGSTRGAPEPAITADGRRLSFSPAPLAAGASADVTYLVSVAPGAPAGEAVNRAVATAAGGLTSAEAAAAVRISGQPFADALTIIGRVTAGPCSLPERERPGVPGVRLMMEDGTFAITDRDGLYHFEGVRPGRHVVALDADALPASLAPVACGRDTAQAGSATSRFVEGTAGLLRRADFRLAPTGRAAVREAALPITPPSDAAAAGDRDWFTGRAPAIGWLFPAADHNPRAPSIRVAVQHMPGQRVALTINGAQSDPLAFDGSETRGGVAVSRWSGIPLHDGDNRLTARVLDADGKVATTLERVVHLSGAPRRAELVPALSRVVADGITPPLVAVRVTDATGRPARAGTLVPFRVDAPYAAATDAALEQRRGGGPTEARVVGDDGLAFLALRPTTQAGALHAVVTMTEGTVVRTSDVRTWLSASRKDWMVVGFGAGTVGRDVLSRHAAALAPGAGAGPITDGEIKLYAKGRIKGAWLLTLAYDSAHAYDPDRGLLNTIDPTRYYTVYGDGTVQGYDAATRGKLYLRLERREAYALFGDFESGLTEARLTRYARTLNGVKAAYGGTKVQATGFAAHTSSDHARDEIAGNGLSGPYRLSGRDIVPGSDQLRVEVRDRLRPDRVVSSQVMARDIDYSIDLAAGAVTFRSPVLGRDADMNPIVIVAEYELEGGQPAQLVAAGRVATRLAKGTVELGAGAIRDGSVGGGMGEATVVGVDLKARPGRSTELRAEVATGGRGGLSAGTAFLAEAERRTGSLDVLAYARQQDSGFGVGQQNFVDAGTRRVGVDANLRLGGAFTLAATAWDAVQLDGPGSQVAAQARIDWRRAGSTLFVGGRYAADRGLNGGDQTSGILTLGASRSLADGRITLSGETEIAPGGAAGSADFPIRHQIIADWRVSRGVHLIGGYEIADGDGYTSHTARVGFDLSPWAGAKLSSTLDDQAAGIDGRRLFARYGVAQSLRLSKHWSIDATLDATGPISGALTTAATIAPFQTATAGAGLTPSADTSAANGYAAETLGAAYRAEVWTLSGRAEHRRADGAERWGLTGSFLRALGGGQTLAAGVRAYRIEDAKGAVAADVQADLSVALRPLGECWAVLERLQFRLQRADVGFTDSNALGVSVAASTYDGQETNRLVNNLALNWSAPATGAGHGMEASVYYGAKWIRGHYGDDPYDGYVDVTGFDLRHDLGEWFDIGVQGSVQHAWKAHAVAYSGGPALGASPGGGLWITAGWNVTGYRDRDFEADRYTRQGPYVTMRLKFDRHAIGAAARALFGGGR